MLLNQIKTWKSFQVVHGGRSEEGNLVMMALLRFFNISAVRVGGNTDFEGTAPRATPVGHGPCWITCPCVCRKVMMTSIISTMMALAVP